MSLLELALASNGRHSLADPWLSSHVHFSSIQAPQDLGSGTEGSSCLCSYDQWSLLHILPSWWSYCHRDKRWPCPILDGSPSPVLTEALMQESPPTFPDYVSSPSTANPQEDERVPHLQDFLAVPAARLLQQTQYQGLARMEPGGSRWTSVNLPPHGMCEQVRGIPLPWCQPYLAFVCCEQSSLCQSSCVEAKCSCGYRLGNKSKQAPEPLWRWPSPHSLNWEVPAT